ncbi:MAG: methyltransferase [Candidatus Contendobacter odensis]|uniref:Methyltransferase n=1 Tax=Candidatus Contendibacter odensensis TaxID=1400860 RepID=A0A2G6PFG2_9GAMM|nr:MAG: methyltransferase [Candidatus Contendobacter odensis]
MSLKESVTAIDNVRQLSPDADRECSTTAQIPEYLQQTYWWAYLHPAGVRLFERQWLVNLILWGNFTRLRDMALEEMGSVVDGKVLQVACVYGNFTERLMQRLGANGHLDIVDVAPIQLRNLQAKIKDTGQVTAYLQDSSDLQFEDASYDNVIVFFLLHEQPEAVRRKTIAEALRVAKPGGKVIFVDYHRPRQLNPFRYLMIPVLKTLEPFAMDLWRQEITDWLPEDIKPEKIEKQIFFSGLYQKVVMTR